MEMLVAPHGLDFRSGHPRLITEYTMQTAIFCDHGPNYSQLPRVFGPTFKAHLEYRAKLFPEIVTQSNFANLSPKLRDTEAIFATWGMWSLAPEQLEALPNLKAVFYAAGSVRHFAPILLERDIIVTSSWQANAIPVAQFTLSQILLSNKGYWRNQREYENNAQWNVFSGRGNYGATVAVLGAGQVGRKLIELLRPFDLRVIVFDPFLSYKGAEALGVEKVELEEAFATGDVVSNHVADLPATYDLIRGEHLCLMPKNATFINTGRGRTVNQDELEQVFARRDDLTALLDVTEPEPLPLDHPLRRLPNVHLTCHIAGSIGDEVGRMGEYALQEFERWQNGEPLRYAVNREMLDTMA
ncbi:hydroxyacid dehydrogenase [bacterium]|nr:MAG: hydroxyacid dehydrogenase [bacterium]